MILQLRGTGGSGKTHSMKIIKEELGNWDPVYIKGRKQPMMYVHADRPIFLLGHYESACGGCDSIGSAKAVYEQFVTLLSQEPQVILAEGLLLSEDVKWTTCLYELEPDLRILYLTTPLERCLRQIQDRRTAIGNEKPLNPDNTTNRLKPIERSRIRLTDLGVNCRRVTPEQAPEVALNWINKVV